MSLSTLSTQNNISLACYLYTNSKQDNSTFKCEGGWRLWRQTAGGWRLAAGRLVAGRWQLVAAFLDLLDGLSLIQQVSITWVGRISLHPLICWTFSVLWTCPVTIWAGDSIRCAVWYIEWGWLSIHWEWIFMWCYSATWTLPPLIKKMLVLRILEKGYCYSMEWCLSAMWLAFEDFLEHYIW